MATVDATVGGTSANSYCTLAEANTYHGNRLHTATWDATGDADKNKALVWAARLLDEHMAWVGVKKDEDYAMRWPRASVYDEDGYWVDDNIVPQKIKDAQAEFAAWLIASDLTAEPETKGIRSTGVGSLRLEVDKEDRDTFSTIPETVVKIVGVYGSLRNRVAASLKVIRT